MDDLHMNSSLGTKWFTFYTKVRPWLACITTLTVVFDFFRYVQVYTSYWWMMLHLAASIVQAILSILVFVKSRGNYIEFVGFVKKVLLYEIISMAYGQGVQQYIQNEFDVGFAIIMGVIIFIVSYFVWYRLNLKYFRKRIRYTVCETDAYGEPAYMGQGNAIDSSKTAFCRKCGDKLLDGAKFCRKCGTEVIEGERR